MRIPKKLREAIIARLKNETRPLNSKQISEAVNPVVASAHNKNPKQMAFVLKQMKREKFNGVELFAVENEQDAMKGINKSHLIVNGELHDNVNGKTYANKAEYEYFDDPLVEKRTKTSFDKYEFQLYTNPSGVEEDGNIKLNIVNLQFMLGIKNPIDANVLVVWTYGPPTRAVASIATAVYLWLSAAMACPFSTQH